MAHLDNGRSGHDHLAAQDVGELLGRDAGPVGEPVGGDGVEGRLHVTEIGWERLPDIEYELVVGDEVKAKILEIKANGERLGWFNYEREAWHWEAFKKHDPTGATYRAEIAQGAKEGWLR